VRIVEDDLSGPEIDALLRLHLAEAHANSPPGLAFAFDIDRLRAPDVTFWSLWDDDALAGCAALKELTPEHGEIKSMRTSPCYLRRGVAARLIDHLVAESRWRGYTRLSLETGSTPAYHPALALYARYGFVEGEQFGGYTPSDFNRFFHLDL
jgi:putative acetyltransferase